MKNKELALALEKEYEETGDNAGTAMPPAPSMAAAIAIVKKRKTKVGTSFDPGVLELKSGQVLIREFWRRSRRRLNASAFRTRHCSIP